MDLSSLGDSTDVSQYLLELIYGQWLVCDVIVFFVMLARVCRSWRAQIRHFVERKWQRHNSRQPFPSLNFLNSYPPYRHSGFRLTYEWWVEHLDIQQPRTVKIRASMYNILKRPDVERLVYRNPIADRYSSYRNYCVHRTCVKSRNSVEFGCMKDAHELNLSVTQYFYNGFGPFCRAGDSMRYWMTRSRGDYYLFTVYLQGPADVKQACRLYHFYWPAYNDPHDVINNLAFTIDTLARKQERWEKFVFVEAGLYKRGYLMQKLRPQIRLTRHKPLSSMDGCVWMRWAQK